MMVAGMAAALFGSWVGARVLRNVSMKAVHRVVAVFLLVIGVALAAGLV